MTRLLYTGGVAPIAVLQHNSLTMPKSTESHTAQNAMFARLVRRGSGATKGQPKPSAE